MALPLSRYVTGSRGPLVVTVADPHQSAPASHFLRPPGCCLQVVVVCPASAQASSLCVKLPVTEQNKIFNFPE